MVWATGFKPDFGWIDLPVLGTDGSPVHYRGVVDGAPGLYFLGLPFQYTITSAFIGGVVKDARYIADHIAGQTREHKLVECRRYRGDSARRHRSSSLLGTTPDGGDRFTPAPQGATRRRERV